MKRKQLQRKGEDVPGHLIHIVYMWKSIFENPTINLKQVIDWLIHIFIGDAGSF